MTSCRETRRTPKGSRSAMKNARDAWKTERRRLQMIGARGPSRFCTGRAGGSRAGSRPAGARPGDRRRCPSQQRPGARGPARRLSWASHRPRLQRTAPEDARHLRAQRLLFCFRLSARRKPLFPALAGSLLVLRRDKPEITVLFATSLPPDPPGFALFICFSLSKFPSSHFS